MSDMGKVVVKQIGGVDVICRELTVGQLRGLMSATIEGELVADFLFEEVRLSDLEKLTNLTRVQLESFPPSALSEVITACKEANPDFFAMLARVARARKAS